MRSGWKKKSLRELGRCIGGLTYSPKDITDSSGLLVLRSSNIQGGRLSFEDNVYVNATVPAESLTQAGDILVCVRNGSRNLIGKNCLITKDGAGNAHGAFMTLYRSEYSEYLYQLFQTEEYYNQVHRNLGATINSINNSDFYEFTFSIPPLPEQQKIAAILRTWDEAIERMEKALELKRKVRSSLIAHTISNQTPNTPLKHFVTNVARAVPKPLEPYSSLGLRSHCKGTFQRFVEDFNRVEMDTLYQVKANDLIVNITFAWEGAVAIVKPEDEHCLVSHRFPTYEIDLKKAYPDFVRYIIQTRRFTELMGIISPGGAGRNRVLNKKDFLEQKVWLPDLKTQKFIGDLLCKAEEDINVTLKLLATYKSQKRGLMQKLLTGAWRVQADKEAA